ncbi:hypothetical protein Gpo141_00005349 [Globisporangium polare]
MTRALPPLSAAVASRDRRMDIAVLCEPDAATESDAYDLEVQAQMRQMSHHSWPLYRAEQDRILDHRGDHDEWLAPSGASAGFKPPPAFLLDNPLVLAANSLRSVASSSNNSARPAATTSSLTAYAPPQIRSRVQLHTVRENESLHQQQYTPISVLSSVALAMPSSSSSSSTVLSLAPAKSSSGKPPASKKRSRRMSNSERGKLYRSRRKNYVDNLEGEVQDLKQEVQGLQIYGRILQEMALHTPQANGGSYTRVVAEYFTIFESGLPPHPDQPFDSNEVVLRPTPRQSVFISTLMDANMAFCGDGGTKRLLKNWECFSLYHASLSYKLKQLQVMLPEPTAVVSADAVLRVRLTRSTLEKMFPHVLWNEPLVQKLVGLEIEYQVGNRFYFSETGKIIRYESQVDFLSAFMGALGSLQDAMLLAGPITERQQWETTAEPSRVVKEEEDFDSDATE